MKKRVETKNIIISIFTFFIILFTLIFILLIINLSSKNEFSENYRENYLFSIFNNPLIFIQKFFSFGNLYQEGDVIITGYANPCKDSSGKPRFEGVECDGSIFLKEGPIKKGVCKNGECVECPFSTLPSEASVYCTRCKLIDTGNGKKPSFTPVWEDLECGIKIDLKGGKIQKGICKKGSCLECPESTLPKNAHASCVRCQLVDGEPKFVSIADGYYNCGEIINILGGKIQKGICKKGSCLECPESTLPKNAHASCVRCQLVDGEPKFSPSYEGLSCKKIDGTDSKCFRGACGFQCEPLCNECQDCQLVRESLSEIEPKCVGIPSRKGMSCKTNPEKEKRDGICNEKGECIKSDCEEIPECYTCDYSSSPPKLKKLGDGHLCITLDNKEGICINGVCNIKTCELMFGDNFVNCGGRSSELKCCYKDKCCSMNILGLIDISLCCRKDEICNFFEPFINRPSIKSPYCKLNECKEPKPIKCPSDGNNVHIVACCPKEKPKCLIFDKEVKVPIYGTSDNTYKTASCGKDICGSEETKCPSDKENPFEGGVLCCDKYEKCIISPVKEYPIPLCIADCSKIKPGYFCCQGKSGFGADYSSTAKWCKDGLEFCHTSNGIPWCYPIKDINGELIKTKSTSIYLIREKDYISLDGIGYVITPHMEFLKDIEILFNYSYYNYNKPVTYRFKDYEAVLESCNHTLLKNVSKIIGIFGGIINISDKIIMNISENSLENLTMFSIQEYNLSNCYKLNDQDNILNSLYNLDSFLALSRLNSFSLSQSENNVFLENNEDNINFISNDNAIFSEKDANFQNKLNPEKVSLINLKNKKSYLTIFMIFIIILFILIAIFLLYKLKFFKKIYSFKIKKEI
ncbi:MAG: hypothetical protein QXW97_03125 [Candidatus Pacearchaeota archaeon]